MNVEALSRQLQSQIAEWTAKMFEIHLPHIYSRVIALMLDGWNLEAKNLLEHHRAFIVQDTGRPYWRALEIDSRIVAEHDFSPAGIPMPIPIFHEFLSPEGLRAMFPDVAESRSPITGRWADPDYQCVIDQPLANPAHVDGMINQIDRDERKRRQKRLGRLFVKYGINQAIEP